MWLHGDLHPANVVVADGTLAGVVDFGELCTGDPATDLDAARLLLPAGAAPRFFTASGDVDRVTVGRARRWAVLRAVYFHRYRPGLGAGLARRPADLGAGRPGGPRPGAARRMTGPAPRRRGPLGRSVRRVTTVDGRRTWCSGLARTTVRRGTGKAVGAAYYRVKVAVMSVVLVRVPGIARQAVQEPSVVSKVVFWTLPPASEA